MFHENKEPNKIVLAENPTTMLTENGPIRLTQLSVI